MKKVFIIILHYGDSNLTLNCIESIINTKNKFEEIVVVDNHVLCHPERSEGSRFFGLWPQNDKWSKKIKIIKNKKNLGYAGGMNIGIKYALSKGADYVLLLNNDVFFEKEIISNLVNFFEKNKNAGIVTPAIKFMRNKKTIYDLGGKVNKLFGKTSHNEVENINGKNIKLTDYVSGCCMFVRRETFEKIGLFDTRFFLYYEDVDFCLRAKRAGFKTIVLPSVFVFHRLSESVGENSPLAIYHQTKSALLFGSKNFFFKRPINLLFIFLQSILISLKSYKNIKPVFKAFFDFYKNNFFLIILSFTLLSFLSFHKSLNFTFWKDDWFAVYSKDTFNSYLLHPAGTIETFLFVKLFGLNVFFWQLFGILFRILDSFGVYLMIKQLTRSKITGFFAGLFFASTFAGLDAIGWSRAHVSNIAIFFLCISIYFWIRYYQEQRNGRFLLYLLFLSFSMISDPVRVLPIILLLPVLRFTLFKKIKNTNFVKIFNISLYIFLSVVSLLILWYLKITNYPGFNLVSKIIENPSFLLNKSYLIGNYFGSLGNMIFGWLINIPEEASTGVYNKLQARLAFFLISVLPILSFIYLKRKSQKIIIPAFFILWIIIFYIPNWIAEPRLTLSGTHRFMVFSSVGFIGLTAYLISLLRNKYAIILLSVFFVAMNVNASNRILSEQSKYRSKILVDSLWDKIDKDVPTNEKGSIFMYAGEEPARGQALALSGSIPYGIKRQIKDPYDLPIVTDDLQLILKLLCSNNSLRYQPGKMVVQKSKIPLSHYHVWEVTNNGDIKDISIKERLRIKNIAEKSGCKELFLQEKNNN